MNLSGITPPFMNWNHTNLPAQWDKFKRYAELIFSGPLEEKTEPEKVAYLLIWVGEKGRDIRATWTDIREEDAGKLETYYQRYQDYVQPKLNPVMARFKFFNEIQGGDSIDQYVTRLRLSTKYCSFPDADEMIRDQLVYGTNSSKIRKTLINVGSNLTLDRAIQIAQSLEHSRQQMQIMAEEQARN